MLAAELHNSSLSSGEYMDTVWAEMKKMNINTLLGSVSWEMIEPVEGQFDFDELDKCIVGARKHGLRLVLLYFGSFKNALSTYVPGWVKKDIKRFPRVHSREAGGQLKTQELLSPFNPRAWEADAKAFAALMRHLKEVDEAHSTVLMVQVENETGLLGDSRDGSKIANELFKKPVPKELLQHIQQRYENLHPAFQKRFPDVKSLSGSPTWEEAFPGDISTAEEMFMADAYSKFIGHVSKAGKAEYDIPFYVNVWLNFDDASLLDTEGISGLPPIVGGGAKPGVYPSGGPVPHTMDIYRYNAPSLDFVGVDLYLHDYESVCVDYRHGGQPLFIPEQKRDDKGARRVWLAYGTYLAIGCSPFGIDSHTAAESPFTKTYGLLASMSKHILEAQANRPDDMMGFFFDEMGSKEKNQWVKQFGEFELTVERSFVFGKPTPGAGMVIRQEDGSFLLIGWGFQVTFKSTNPKSTFTGILYAEEKKVDVNQNLTTLRVMNGDETRSGAFYIMPSEDPDYGEFTERGPFSQN